MKWIGTFLIPVALCAAADNAKRLEALEDPTLNSTQRNTACFELRGERSEAAVAAFRRSLGNSSLRACAGRNLREAGAAQALRAAITDSDPETAATAIRELGALERPEMLGEIAKLARSENLLIASSALTALSFYKDRAVLPYLIELIPVEGMVGVTAMTHALEFRDAAILVPARRLLAGSDLTARLAAIRVIAELGGKDDLLLLEKIAATETQNASSSRGFGFMPSINLGLAARRAVEQIRSRG